jgi:ribosomal protein S12 methylthiotransferase
VLIDEIGPTVAKGRSKGDAPEIDGTVYVAARCASASSPR